LGGLYILEEDVFNVPKLRLLDFLHLLKTRKHIIGIEVNNGFAVVTRWFEIKRKSAEIDVEKWNECGCGSVIEMVFGCLPLLTNTESDVEIGSV
jgi:hypothetical protein